MNWDLSIKIQVLFGFKIFNFNISGDEKSVFKVKDLKKKCCEYWKIPIESHKKYQITHKMLVFSQDELLNDIFIGLFEGVSDMSFSLYNMQSIHKHFLGNEIHLNKDNDEFSDINNINDNDNNNKNDYLQKQDESDFIEYSNNHLTTSQNNQQISHNHNDMNDFKKINDENEKNYLSEFELYLDELLIYERVSEFVLGNDELTARLKQEEKRISEQFDKDSERKRFQEKEDGIEEDDNEKAERIMKEYYKKEEEIERGLESYKFRYYSSIRKFNEIVVTQHHLFVFRLRNLFALIIYIAFICFLFMQTNLQSAENSFINNISNVAKKKIFTNELYKYFINSKIYTDNEYSPNFLIESKRDLNMFFSFMLNNIFPKNNAGSDKINSHSADNYFGYNLVNTAKFTIKYSQIALRPKDALDKKLFSGSFPITNELNETNEITSNFDLQISDLITEKIIEEKELEKIFPEIVNDQNVKKLAYNLNNPEYDSEKVLKSYNNNGYQFYLIFGNFNANNYDKFSGQIIRYIFSKLNFKYLKMSISFFNPILNSMININLVIEVLSIGFIASSIDLNVINIANNSGEFHSVLTFTYIYAIFFLLNFLLRLLFCVFAEKRLKPDKTLINRKILLYDFVCIVLYIFFVTLEYLTSTE